MHLTQANQTRAPSKAFRHFILAALAVQSLLGTLLTPMLRAQPAPPQVASTKALGVGVEVTFLRGLPAPPAGGLDVVVTSPICGEMGRQYVATTTAQMTTIVPNVLSSVLTCGTQYMTVLEDLTGPMGLPLPFQVRLECNNNLHCNYRLDPRVEAENALVFSPALDQALTQATGSGNLVDAVGTSHPQLRNEVLTYALHLDRLLAAQGLSLTSSCTCQWVGIVQRTGTSSTGSLHPYAVQACPQSPTDSRSGTTTLETTIRCHTLGTGPSSTLLLPGGQPLAIPAFNRCTPVANPPSPATNFSLTFDGLAQAWGDDVGYKAEAEINIDFSFDGLSPTNGSAEAWKPRAEDFYLHSVPLSLNSGLVAATQATVSTNATAEVKPPHGSTFTGSPNLGAEAGGTLVIEATHGGVDLSWIRLWEATNIFEKIDDYLDEGEDAETCGN